MSAAAWSWISFCLAPLRVPLGLRRLPGTAIVVVGLPLMFPG